MSIRKLSIVFSLLLLSLLACNVHAGQQVSFVKDNKLKLIDVDTRQQSVIPGVLSSGEVCYPTWIDHNRLAFLHSSGKSRDVRRTWRVGVVNLKTGRTSWVGRLASVSSLGYDSSTQSLMAERVVQRKDGSAPRFMLTYHLTDGKLTKRTLYKGEAGELEVLGPIEPHRISRIYGTPYIEIALAVTGPSDLFAFYDSLGRYTKDILQVLPKAHTLFKEKHVDGMDFRTPYITDFACGNNGVLCVSLTDYDQGYSKLYALSPNSPTWKLMHEVKGAAQFLSPGFSPDGCRLVYAKNNAWTVDAEGCKVWIADMKDGGSPSLLCDGAYPQFRP